MEALDMKELDKISHLYGADLAPEMAALADALKPIAAGIIDEFHQHLSTVTGTGELFRNLAEADLNHMKQRQAGILIRTASPDLTFEQHYDANRRAGRTHAIFGLSSRDLAYAQALLYSVVTRSVDASAHHAALALLSRRMFRGLIWQLEASERVSKTLHDVLLRMTELAWSATSHTDLIDKAVSILAAVDSCVGCSFGRPDVAGIFRFESAAGEKLIAHLAELEAADFTVIMRGAGPQGQTPTGRAWVSGDVERCINIETDHRMEIWREISRRNGIRSSVAIPLCSPGRTPTAVLTLFSELPGGFTSVEQVGFIRQVQATLTIAFANIENRTPVSNVTPWSTRQRWASLIGTPALEMHYQPIRDLVSGRVTRAEALVRLRDGDEILAPDKFFPCLAREDFVSVFIQGLHQVLDQQNRWLRNGLDIQVSINLPVEALCDSRYYEITREALRRYGGRPQRLMLEVLEASGTTSREDERQGIEKFRTLGIKLAEDDLGAGHSNLDRLRALSFDVIKFDRSLVLDVERSSLEVLSSIFQLTNLCHALGKSVVVEGVESVDLIDAVALLGADAVQGYAIARPMPAPLFADWMRQHGELYEAPDRMYPKGPLARLARLLIWESHVHLLFGTPQSRVIEIAEDYTPALPFRSVTPALQTSLLDAAIKHGIASPEYRIAREKLIATLSRGC